MWLTEAGTQRRASLHLVEGAAGLQSLSAGGIEPLEASVSAFTSALCSANHTLKRALTDSHLFSGIGNAYSDEILHRAQLSPIAMTRKLTEQELARLYETTRATLLEWIAQLRAESATTFPEKVTAFRPGMAVHGRYGQPCPRCGAKVQRIPMPATRLTTVHHVRPMAAYSPIAHYPACYTRTGRGPSKSLKP